MPLETATYVSDLVTSNPAAADSLSGADDHLRLIKSALRATFPYSGTIHNSAGASLPPDGTAANPTYAFASEPALGFYRSGPATLAYTGTLLGAAPVGAIIDFAGPGAPTGYLSCDGQAVSRTTYAALFAAIGTIWGVGDGSTTFNVPNLQSRFRRHRDNNTNFANVVGTTQAPCNLTHTHTGGGTTSAVSNDHTHTFSGATGSMSQNATHSHTYTAPALGAGTGTSPNYFNSSSQTLATSVANTDHTHAFSGTTGGISANHTHTYSFTTSGGSADSIYELRPYCATVLSCIRAY